MEKKYSVVIKKGEDLSLLDKELADSTGNGVIPNRAVRLGNPLPSSNRVTEWLLTEEEAEELKKDPRVLDVEDLSNFEFKLLGSGSIPCKLRRAVDVNSSLAEELQAYVDNDPIPHANWALGRHQKFTDDHMEVIEGSEYNSNLENSIGSYGDTFDYDYDGEGVDIIILDSGVEEHHPEWRDADGNSRFKAIDWQEETGFKVMLDDGTGELEQYHQPADFYRDYVGHGTACASLAAGYYNGFAKGAHIYAIKMLGLGLPDEYPTGTDIYDYYSGYEYSEAIQMIKLWHEQKTNGRPTIVNMSFGSFEVVRDPNYINHRGLGIRRLEMDNTHVRNSSRAIAEMTGVKGRKVPNGVTIYPPVIEPPTEAADDDTWEQSITQANIQSAAQDALLEELIDLGIHVCIAAGNNGFKQDVNREEYKHRSNLLNIDEVGADYDNYFYARTPSSNNLHSYHYNKPASPYHPDAFNVGALDTTKVCDVADHGDYTNVPQSEEYKGGRHSNSFRSMHHINEIKSEFSAHGPAVNIYAAGVATKCGKPMQFFWNGYPTTSESSWMGQQYKYDLSSSENKGLNIEVDTAGDAVRFYVSVAQDAIDELDYTWGIDLHTLRTTLHYDTTDAALAELFELAVMNGSTNHTVISDEYMLCFDAGMGNASWNTDTQTYFKPYGNSNDDIVEYPQIASSATKRAVTGSIYLEVDYNKLDNYYDNNGTFRTPRDTQPLSFDHAGAGVQQNAHNSVVNRVIFEVGFQKSKYSEYDDVAKTWNGKPIEDLLTVGSVAFNHLDSSVTPTYDHDVINTRGRPLYKGAGYNYDSGTSMASPVVAGLLAVNIEKEGNKTPREYIDFMSSPYSGYSEKNAHFLDQTKTHRTSPNEKALIGFSRDNLETIADPNEMSTGVYNVDDWHSFYTAGNLEDKTVDYTGHVPHNHMIVGPKVIAATAGQQRDFNLSITGDLTLYSGAYSRRADIDVTPPENYSLITPNAISTTQDPWTSKMTIDGNYYSGKEYPIRQDGEWIPKEFEADSAAVTFTEAVSEGNGVFSSSFENNGSVSYNVPTPVEIGASLLGQSTHNKAALTILPPPPVFVGDYSNVTFVENNPNTQSRIILNPQVESVSSYTLGIREGLDSARFTAGTNGIASRYVNPSNPNRNYMIDFDDPDMPNPLQFIMFATDIYGQESEDVLVTLTVTDIPDEAPRFSFTGIGDYPVTASSYENSYVRVEEARGFQDLISYTVTDPDSNDADITYKVELKLWSDWWTEDLSYYGFHHDPVAKTISADNLDFEDLPEGVHKTYESGSGWNGYEYRQLTLRFTAEDAEGNTTEEEFHIRILNRTEKYPEFDESDEAVERISNIPPNIQYSTTIPENTPVGTVVYTLPHITQGDTPYAYANSNAERSWSSGENTSSLDINVNGEVYVSGELDFEAGETYHLWVKVTNTFNRSTYVLINVTVSDVFDNTVTFLNADGEEVTAVSSDIVEHSEAGTVIYEFRTDEPAMVTYDIEMITGSLSHLSKPSGSSHLRVTDLNGNLATEPLTHGYLTTDNEWFPEFEEEDATYYIRLKATNDYGVSYLDITPNIIDDPIKDDFKVLDFSNINEEYVFEVANLTEAGTTLFTIDFNKTPRLFSGKKFFTGVADPDGEGYKSGDTSNTIQGLNIDKETGVVSLSQDVDSEFRDVYGFTVLAQDEETGTSIQTLIIIRVVAAFEAAFFASADDTIFSYNGFVNYAYLDENTPAGTELGTISFVNKLDNDTPLDNSYGNYQVDFINPNGDFVLEAGTEDNTFVLKTGVDLDYETAQFLTCEITTTDPDGNNVLTPSPSSVITSKTFYLAVNNLDEAAPVWQNQTDTYEVAVDTPNNTILFTLEASDATEDTGDVESNPVTYTSVHSTGDFFSYFTIDQTSGQVLTIAPLVNGINASVVAQATDAAGNYNTKTFFISTPTISRVNILNEWQNFSTVVTQGTGAGHTDMTPTWRVAEIHYENSSAVNGRVIIRGKTTASNFWYNDIAVAGWQVLDEDGNLLLNFNSLNSGYNASSESHLAYNGNTPVSTATNIFADYSQYIFIPELPQDTSASDGSRWYLANSTSSSNTGPSTGYQIEHSQILDPDSIYAGMANVPYLYMETSWSAVGRCYFLCQAPWSIFSIPQKGSIRIMYFNSGDANTIDGDDTLAVAIGV